MTAYEFAPEVERVAKELIRTEPDHALLERCRVLYVWRDKASKSMGRVVLGRARRISGLNAFLITSGEEESLYVIEIAADEWGRLTEPQRVALVDHELCHCRVLEEDDGSLSLKVRGHDVEEFFGIVERHGLWKRDVELLGVTAASQLRLDLDLATGEILDPDAPESGSA